MAKLKSFLLWFILFLVFAEVVLRVFVPGIGAMRPSALKAKSLTYDSALFARHVFPQQEQRVNPSFGERSASGAVTYHINTLGYRGGDFDIEKKPGVIRVMVYGGSSAFDLDQPEGKDWPHRVEAYLKEEGFPNVEMINAGIPRHTTIDCLGRFLAEGHHFDPDAVILYAAWNDIKDFADDRLPLRRMKPYQPEENPFLRYHNGVDQFLGESSLLYTLARYRYYRWALKPRIEGAAVSHEGRLMASARARAQFKLNVELFVDAVRNVGAVPILVTEATLIGQADDDRLRTVAEYLPADFSREAMAAANDMIRAVAREKGVMLIDAQAELREEGVELFNDHVHLNDAGSRALAVLVKDFLKALPEMRGPAEFPEK